MPLGLRHALLLGLAALPLRGADEPVAERAVALLEERCFKCHSHSAGKNKGGLVMDSLAGLTTGGDSGAALLPGDPAKSLFLKNILSTDPDVRMPPKGDRLTATQVKLLQDWVKPARPGPGAAPRSPSPVATCPAPSARRKSPGGPINPSDVRSFRPARPPTPSTASSRRASRKWA